MKKVLTLAFAVAIAASASAQVINYRIEQDFITISGVNQNFGQVNIYSSLISSADFAALSFSVAPTVEEVNALATNASFTAPWTLLGSAVGPIGATYDWNLQRTFAGTDAGLLPVILIANGEAGGLVDGSYIGLVASTSGAVPALGTNTVTFLGGGGSFTFDTVKLGAPGSFALQMVGVPEPSTFALLGGLLALGFVVYRRRR